MKLLVIIPAYNEEGSILNTVKELRETCPQYDYVVVNDGSTDHTAQLCRENGLHMLDLPVNLGLSGAFQAGMKYAFRNGYDAAVQFDADGQHRPEYLPVMEKKLAEGYDIVIGSRFVEKEKPRTMRMLGSTMISAAVKVTTGKKLKDPTSGLRLYNRRMIQQFALQMNIDPEPDTIAYFMRSGAKVVEVQTEMRERTTGESYMNPVRSIEYMLRVGISIILIQFFRHKLDI